MRAGYFAVMSSSPRSSARLALAAAFVAAEALSGASWALAQNEAAARGEQALAPLALRAAPSQVRFLSDESRGAFLAVTAGGVQIVSRDGREIASWPPSPAQIGARRFGDVRPVVLRGPRVDGLFAVSDDRYRVYLFSPEGQLVRSFRAGPESDAPGAMVGAAHMLPNGLAVSIDARAQTLSLFDSFGVRIGGRTPLGGPALPFVQPLLNPAGLIVLSIDVASSEGRIVFLKQDGSVARADRAPGVSLLNPIAVAGSQTGVARLVDFRPRLWIYTHEGQPVAEYASRREEDFRPHGFPSGGFALVFSRGRAVEFIGPRGELTAQATADSDILRAVVDSTGALYVATRAGVRAYGSDGAELAWFPGVDARVGLQAGRDGSTLAIGENAVVRLWARERRAEAPLTVAAPLQSALRMSGEGGDVLVATLRSGWETPIGSALSGSSLVFFRAP